MKQIIAQIAAQTAATDISLVNTGIFVFILGYLIWIERKLTDFCRRVKDLETWKQEAHICPNIKTRKRSVKK